MTTKPKTVPELRFPEFDEKWKESPMSELLTFKNGYNAAKEQYGTGVKFINVLDIIQNDFITHDRIIGSVEIPAKDFGKNEVKHGDILFQRSSETREEVGQTNVYLDRDKSATFGGFVIRGRPLKTFDPVFFNSMLKTAKARKDITSRSGGSTRYNIGQESLEDVLVSIAPTLPEQRKIADFLTAVDRRIAQLRQKKALMEDYKKGVMQQLFTQALRFKDDHGNEFPDWEEKTVGDVAKLISGQHLDPDQYDDSGEGVPYFTGPSDFTSNPAKFTKWTKYSSKVAPPDSILICVKGNGVGKLMYSTLPQVAMGRQLMGIRSDLFSSVLLYQFLLTKTQQFVALGSGNLIPGLSRPDILTFSIPVPSLLEQAKIANFLTALDRKIDGVAQQVCHTQAFKKGLLQQMFV
jgi:type I restriction enzyme, S subunit